MKKFSSSFSGYNKQEVNEFVAQVADKYEEMLKNLKNRDTQIESLNEKLVYYKNIENTLNRAVSMAEDTANQIRKISREEYNSIIKEAKANASQIVNDALKRSAKIEQNYQDVKRRISITKLRLKQTLEEELAIIDDIDNIDY